MAETRLFPVLIVWLVLALAAIIRGSGINHAAGQGLAARPAPPALQGVATCAAAGCHHGNQPQGTQGSEYTTWVIHDRHARAYASLLTDKARRIEQVYRALPRMEDARPEQSAFCLDCHVYPGINKASAARPANLAPSQKRGFALTDGVGCESCHGPAEKWLGPHRTWKSLDLDQKRRAYAEHGMNWLRDLEQRGRVCAGCHLGAADRDINHDLIAAGHPWLNFEYAGFMAAMPKHWDAQADRNRYPDFEVRVWAFGQVLTTRSALELLAARADTAGKPWPEFAEYDCRACHHHPGLPDPKGQARDRPIGQPPWSGVFSTMLPQAHAFWPDGDLPGTEQALEKLRKEMEKPLPDRRQAADLARHAANLLGGWLGEIRRGQFSQPGHIRKMLLSLSRDPPSESWDRTLQRYLAMSAMYHALRDLNPQDRDLEFKKDLDRLARELDSRPP